MFGGLEARSLFVGAKSPDFFFGNWDIFDALTAILETEKQQN